MVGGRSTSLFGLWGVVLLVFGGVAFAVTPAASAYVFLHVGLGILLLVLYLTASRENLSTFLGERSTKYGANAVVYSLIFIGILVIANCLASRHNHRWDLTKQNVFSLSTQSRNVLAKLDKPVEVVRLRRGRERPAASRTCSTATRTRRTSSRSTWSTRSRSAISPSATRSPSCRPCTSSTASRRRP